MPKAKTAVCPENNHPDPRILFGAKAFVANTEWESGFPMDYVDGADGTRGVNGDFRRDINCYWLVRRGLELAGCTAVPNYENPPGGKYKNISTQLAGSKGVKSALGSP